MALVHVVLFKYRAGVDEASRDAHRTVLRSLADMDGVLSLATGGDILKTRRSYDTGLVIRFRDRAALDAYALHPRHVAAVDDHRPIVDHTVAADFDG